MSSIEITTLIKPVSLSTVPEAVSRLCGDLSVGGILLNNELATALVDEGFVSLATGLPTTNACIDYIAEPHTFDQDHEWHLPRQSEYPKIKILASSQGYYTLYYF